MIYKYSAFVMFMFNLSLINVVPAYKLFVFLIKFWSIMYVAFGWFELETFYNGNQ